jgi:hypothetical protein
MKIYFGRTPEVEFASLDVIIFEYLKETNWHWENAVDKMVSDLGLDEDEVWHTLNPLIINFFEDEFAKQYVYMIDENGEEIFMGTDESMLKKLKFIGPGDVVCDDARSFL